MLRADDAAVGVGRAAEADSPLQHDVLHLLGEVHVEEAGVQAASVELVDAGEGVLLRHHVDEAVAVHDDDVDDGAEAGEQGADVRRVHRVGDVVDVDGEKFQRRRHGDFFFDVVYFRERLKYFIRCPPPKARDEKLEGKAISLVSLFFSLPVSHRPSSKISLKI